MGISKSQYYPRRNRSFVADFFNTIERNVTTHIPVNVKELETEYQLELVVPGYKKELFSIDVELDKLTIEYKQPTKETEEGNNESIEKFLVRGYEVKDFKKVYKLPENVNTEKLSAKFEQGILLISLVKSEEKAPLKVSIQ
ncbi:Hsp20/alpha crystallin family protein [Flammeovirga agarivorans]|uniref:Hsp20/alpha crystallin family protein n=1 Tax=Flammeovirga agarivorans TaxID=2726742 RepID=A0A7X8SMS2_9BACT|nr:Hsp20/alpha crystallin family protein [Flammeovirga agarivorans]NLR93053.1 Hsp20/alpha crystallin family protein [Flammeovirga agarivorans]